VQGSGFGVQGSGFRFQGAGFRVQGSGCRVEGAKTVEGVPVVHLLGVRVCRRVVVHFHLDRKGNSNSHGARPVHQIISVHFHLHSENNCGVYRGTTYSLSPSRSPLSLSLSLSLTHTHTHTGRFSGRARLPPSSCAFPPAPIGGGTIITTTTGEKH